MAPYCCTLLRAVTVIDAGYLSVSSDAFMKAGGVDAYGAARALRVDDSGRAICAPARIVVDSDAPVPAAYNPGEGAMLMLVCFAAGFLLRHGLAWGAKVIGR